MRNSNFVLILAAVASLSSAAQADFVKSARLVSHAQSGTVAPQWQHSVDCTIDLAHGRVTKAIKTFKSSSKQQAAVEWTSKVFNAEQAKNLIQGAQLGKQVHKLIPIGGASRSATAEYINPAVAGGKISLNLSSPALENTSKDSKLLVEFIDKNCEVIFAQ